MSVGPYYWCLEHKRVEVASDRCKADNRLGPYVTEAEARNWRERVEDRNDAWDDQDEDWHGEGSEP